MNGGEVGDTWFVEVRDTFYERGVRGYDGSEVADLLRRVADALAAGQPAGPLIENATFQVVAGAGSRRYDIEVVDWFFEQLLRREDHREVTGTSADPWRHLAVANQFTLARADLSEPPARPSWRARRKHLAERQKYFSGECASAWRDFDQQPGMHLRRGQVGTGRYELRTPERQK